MLTKMKRTLITSIFLIYSGAMLGCSSQPQTTVDTTAKELEAEMAEWRKLKPGVQRLVAIEKELKGLLTTLEAITEAEPTLQLTAAENNANIQTEVITPVSFDERKYTASESKQEQTLTVADTTQDSARILANEKTELTNTKSALSQEHQPPTADLEAIVAKPANVRSFSLQLASVTKEESVDSTWEQLKKRHPTILGKLNHHSEQVLVANRTYYRVKAGNYDNYDDAKQDCKVLLSSGASCIVNKG